VGVASAVAVSGPPEPRRDFDHTFERGSTVSVGGGVGSLLALFLTDFFCLKGFLLQTDNYNNDLHIFGKVCK